jgi:hypothetical protein
VVRLMICLFSAEEGEEVIKESIEERGNLFLWTDADR